MLFNLAVPHHAIIRNPRGVLWPGEPKGMSIGEKKNSLGQDCVYNNLLQSIPAK